MERTADSGDEQGAGRPLGSLSSWSEERALLGDESPRAAVAVVSPHAPFRLARAARTAVFAAAQAGMSHR